jgi:colanic acid/amylovoran biosynthesis glycosyltransferase
VRRATGPANCLNERLPGRSTRFSCSLRRCAKPVKIIYVTARLPHGTDEAFVIPEVQRLIRLGHEVLVIPRSPGGPILHGRSLLGHARLEMLFSFRVLKAAAFAVLQIRTKLAGIVLSILGTRSPAVAMKNLAVVPKALWLADLVERWGADHIHCHWAGTTATMTMLASRITGIPWSLTAHRWDIVENNLLKNKSRSASFVRFISQDGLRMARRIGISSEARTRVIHMGVAIPGSVSRRGDTRPVVLCTARLADVKGHQYLLQAWRILRTRGLDGELWLAGDGPLRKELESLAVILDLSGSVKFLGAVEHGKILDIYAGGGISAVVLASIDLGNEYHEGIPVSLIEAMSYAVPVIATATGGTPELLVPGTGLLVSQRNPLELADALDRVLRDPDMSQGLGRAGRDRVTREYDIDRTIATLLHEFEPPAKPQTVSMLRHRAWSI